MELVQAGPANTSKPATHYCEEGLDLAYVQFKYEGIKVEVGNASDAQIFDAASQAWVPLNIEFDSYDTASVLELGLPLMLKEGLIPYKTMLSRTVDIDDIRAMR